MGTCRICGKNFGLIGGYMEEFTGERLNVCVDCIKKFRQISEEDSSRVRTIVDDLISSCNNEKTLPILKKYKAMEILGGVSENYHNTIEHQIIDKLELDNLMDEFDRDNQRKILELLIVGYSQKEIRKLLEINLYRWKKLMTDTKVLVEKYLDEYYND